ncbi:hypothetical protein BaRGS_00006679, partial [Batillaria attramentaria]
MPGRQPICTLANKAMQPPTSLNATCSDLYTPGSLSRGGYLCTRAEDFGVECPDLPVLLRQEWRR